jgi:hypothetical protein
LPSREALLSSLSKAAPNDRAGGFHGRLQQC